MKLPLIWALEAGLRILRMEQSKSYVKEEIPIRVDDAIIEYFPATGEFEDLSIIREEDIVFATYERMDAFCRYIREMNKNLGGKLDNMLEKQDRSLEGKMAAHICDRYSIRSTCILR